MKLNNKGFTLIEVLAVIVILSLLMAIMVPSVGSILNKNKQSNYESLKKSIINSTKMYLSDHRYDITIIDPTDPTKSCETEGINELNVASIGEDITLTDGKLPIQVLVNEGNLKTDSNNNIRNPKNNSQNLDKENSYIIIKYICNKKDFSYQLEDSYLTWK